MAEYDIIKNNVILRIYHIDNKKTMVFFDTSVFSYRPIFGFKQLFGAVDWCEENSIDPLDMSEEDKVAFKLRWL